MPVPLQYLTDEIGNKTAVVISLTDYEQLMEDIDDLAVISKRRHEPTTSQEEFVEELKKDGLLPR